MMQTDNKKDLLPDLVPLKYLKNFCNLDVQCRLVVTVKNQGFAAAPQSTTRVIFFEPGDGSTVDIPTPGIPPLEQVDLDPIPIPITSKGYALFTVIVNAKNEILESDKGNNTVHGACIKSPHCPY